MDKVSLTYMNGGGLYPSPDGSKDPAFFIHVNYKSSSHPTYQIFKLLNLNSVPQIVSTPKELPSIPASQRDQFMKDKMWHVTGGTAHGTLTIYKLIDYVNKKTLREIKYHEPLINLFV